MVAINKHVMRLRAYVVFAFLAIGAGPATTISLTFAPTDQTIGPGERATVDVLVSDPAGELVAAYDFLVDYDPAVIELDSVTFGVGLGGPADSFQDVVVDPLGQVNVSELSVLFDLSGLQDGTSDLLLFSLTFNSASNGTSPLAFSENILGVAGGFLGDTAGLPIALDALGTGSIAVVPLPASVWLLGSGLLGFLSFSAKRNRKLLRN
ncbi:MAG: cohesin domain-containing protein [Thiogranum sp.]